MTATLVAMASRLTPLGRVALAWLSTAAVLTAGLYPQFTAGSRALKLTDWLLFHQDLTVLWAIAAVALVGLAVSFAPTRLVSRGTSWIPSIDLGPRRALAFTAGLAIVCGLIAWAGTFLVYDGYALSMDEVMAKFDAAILAHGQLMAPIPARWRAYADALGPTFITLAPGDVAWSSQYLPVNAALRAVGVLAGAPSLVSPILAAVSVIAVFAVARRLWPARPGLAVAAAVLLATSSQVLVTAMTAYAMTAHLAFNLVWLWLFLRGGRLGHAGAIGIGFMACGLHQFAFHPLFVAPFVLQLLIERRWRAAGLYIAAYAASLAFWVGYWRIAFALTGHPASLAAGGVAAAHDLTSRVAPLLRAFSLQGVRSMAANLIRFATWQSLLAIPLALLGAWAGVKSGVMRSLALGFVLTGAAMFVILPYQGHGWGYRYWHGLIGSAALLGAFGWGRLTQPLAPGARRTAAMMFASFAAISLLALFPLRAWQAHAFEHPYDLAEAAIARAPTDLVLVDPTGAWFASDLVRNDPYLRNRPLVLDARELSAAQADALCARYTISLFDADDAIRLGVKPAKKADDDTGPPVPVSRRSASTCGAG